MLLTKSATEHFLSPLDLSQRLNKTPVWSSRQLDWTGILVERCQYSSTAPFEMDLPAISAHWINLSLGSPAALIQKRDDRLHESIIQQGDTIFVPAGQPSSWYQSKDSVCSPLHICLKPELIAQVAEASEIDPDRVDLINCFGQQDVQLHHIAMLFLAELQSGGIMGRLYAESLAQVLAIHLLHHYSTYTQPIASQDRSLTRKQLQQAINFIHTHLDQDLSLTELASIINITPTYFASLFKRSMGISPHQYVIQQRVEKARLMLKKTDLAIADIALQVGFSSQSHLTQQFKRLTGVTPRQVRF
jgi:AraC family transcriptional regulator